MRTAQGGGGGAFVIFTEKENVQQLRSVCGNPGASEARSCNDLGGEGVQQFVACTARSL